MAWTIVRLHPADWAIVAGYVVLSLALGVYFSRRASRSMADFFVSGRALPWWLAGTSMVATTFAADTPLAVSGLVRKEGIFGNWYWWSGLFSAMLATFVYARLWRRTALVTDIEFTELRYSGRGAAGLRAFRGLYGAVIANSVVMGWVIGAMAKIVGVLLGWPKGPSVAALTAAAFTYSFLAGLWGVVATDFVQFTMAMAGSLVLAAFSVKHVGGLFGMVEGLTKAGFSPVLSVIPDLKPFDLAALSFVVYVAFHWWAVGTPDGGGYITQRVLACRSERDSVLAMLWFSVAHFVLRPWPWILVGLCSLLVFPRISDPEAAYPAMMARFLPPGLLGLMVAAMLAAFMSTIDTHLNWAASYLTNDIYRRFVKRGASEGHYVLVSRLMIAAVMAMGTGAAFAIESISAAWKFLSALMAGCGPVYILRWFWRRINAWSEISAMAASLATAIVVYTATPISAEKFYPIQALVIFAVTQPVWLAVTLLTRPVPEGTWQNFVEVTRPVGRWLCPALLDWLLGVGMVFGALVGLGEVLLTRFVKGLLLLLLSLACGLSLLRRHSPRTLAT